MSAYLSPIGGAGWQFFTNAGLVLNGGKIYTYTAGSTTPKETWTDSTQLTQNANPIILDSYGRPPNEVWIEGGTNNYKFIITDSNDVAIGTYDNITGIAASNAIQSEWIAPGYVVTYVSGTTFEVPGNLASVYQVNRRVQYFLAGGTYYGTVLTSTYNGTTKTTVVITPDATNLDATVSAVNYGFMSATNYSVPNVFVPSNNPTMTGTVTIPTAAAGNDSTKAASTAFAMHMTSPAFLGAPTAPTAAPGTSTTQLATTAFAAALGLSAALPGQLGNDGKFVTTDGTTASWSDILFSRIARTSNTILTAANNHDFIDVTSGTFTQTFDPAATVGAGWWCLYRNSGTGDVTIPSSDGVTNWIMYTGESRFFFSDGAAYYSVIVTPFARAWTSTGSVVKAPGYKYLGARLWSGAASGQRTNDATLLSMGGGGGGCCDFVIETAAMGASETVTIGAGGAAVTTVANGNIGGVTSIGSLAQVVNGGSFYQGGSVRSGLVSNTTLATTNVGVGYEGGTQAGGVDRSDSIWGGAGASSLSTSLSAGNSIFGGGAGGSCSTAGAAYGGGSSKAGGAGGAASSASNGTAGTAPGGGGGATQTGTASGAGARGEARIWGIA